MPEYVGHARPLVGGGEVVGLVLHELHLPLGSVGIPRLHDLLDGSPRGSEEVAESGFDRPPLKTSFLARPCVRIAVGGRRVPPPSLRTLEASSVLVE